MPLATHLAEDQVAEIIRLRQAGRGIKALALQFHIGPNRVRRLVAKVDAPPVVRPIPIRIVDRLDDDGDKGDNDTDDGARLVDDDTVDEFIATFAGVAPLVRCFMARGPGDYLAEVLVDAADYDRLMRSPAWHLKRVNYGKPGPARFYVAQGQGELLHRVVLADEFAAWTGPERAVVDHIIGNPLDNRRCNLRVATPARTAPTAARQAPPPHPGLREWT